MEIIVPHFSNASQEKTLADPFSLDPSIIMIVRIIDMGGGRGGGIAGPHLGFGGSGASVVLIVIAMVACHYFHYH